MNMSLEKENSIAFRDFYDHYKVWGIGRLYQGYIRELLHSEVLEELVFVG